MAFNLLLKKSSMYNRSIIQDVNNSSMGLIEQIYLERKFTHINL